MPLLGGFEPPGGWAPSPGPFAGGRLVCIPFGDSITAGSTSDPANGIAEGTPGLITGNGYRSYLYDWLHGPNETHGFEYYGTLQSGNRHQPHEGHPGETIGQLRARVDNGVMYGHESQYVILLAGANDLRPDVNRTWQQMVADTDSLIDKILSLAGWTRIVLVEQILESGAIDADRTRATRHQQAYNRALPAIAATKSGRVSIAQASVIGQQMLDGSGVHPTDVGYRWLAYVIYYALAPWLGVDVGDGHRVMTNIPVPPGSPRPVGIL